ncbi:MAG: S9 family peptidase [Bacteroidota bacterium]|nr:S9 family peptidase [Bacteroidota bacterium]
MLKLYTLLFLLIPSIAFCQTKPDSLTIEQIMSDSKWIGTSPSEPFWNIDGTKLFFKWNPEKAPSDSLYYITKENHTPVKASFAQKQKVVSAGSAVYNVERTAYVYEKNGDIFYHEIKPAKTTRITETTAFDYNPQFSFNDKDVVYATDNNLFAWDISTGQTRQLTNMVKEPAESKKEKLTPENQWLKKEQVQYMEVLRERLDEKKKTAEYNEATKPEELRKINIGSEALRDLSISPDGEFISYRLYEAPSQKSPTIVPNYITESGFTTEIHGREKVGEPQGTDRFFIYDSEEDSLYEIQTDSIEGIRDLPEFLKDYPSELKERQKENAPRKVDFASEQWSPRGSHLVLDIRAQDHKDRWLMLWDTDTKKLKLLDRQHDSAWIGGPGIWNTGWIDENNYCYQSEVTGFSHLYSVNVLTGKKKAYTSGNYEVLDAQLSNDKKYFYITTNEVEPAQHQFYHLRIGDSKTDKITDMVGGNEVTISPDEKDIAILYSYVNKPPELYLQENKTGAKPEQITHKAESSAFQSYQWRAPEIITFAARDGAMVHGRVYKPAHPDPHKPAVIFVHGAGYLQNIDKWWSDYYFREFMFNNLLADHGYYVMDVDYRGSAGYGRNWRTAIYRNMGGKDLTDNIDAAKYLVKKFGVDSNRIGIYGGSYGGFMTLMAMFKTPGVFAAGAAIRSVTDWANYNHGYTSAILNRPFEDSLAYQRSSPIYYVSGLKGHLLMCHGMVDQNVHFQDIVKVTERLIELGKDNWQLAPYPMENHEFEDPSSWTDEYKRIFKLFETVLKK